MRLTTTELKHCLDVFSGWNVEQPLICNYKLVKDNGSERHVSIQTACKEAIGKIEELEKRLDHITHIPEIAWIIKNKGVN